jgi:uracil-DNA glycosylase family 4
MNAWEAQGVAGLDEIAREVVSCSLCPRLVEYRRLVAERRPRRHREEDYWARPLPGFGDPGAKILVVGLAPAAHGGNRTGRIFTGDSSGNTLMRALHAKGLSSIPYSRSLDDGLRLKDVFLTASVRCVPPQNRPLPEELNNCYRYLAMEFRALREVRVVVALGALAFGTALRLLRDHGFTEASRRPAFRHGAIYEFRSDALGRRIFLISSYHPSRRNTQTGLLSQRMLNIVFSKAVMLARGGAR